LAKVTQILSDSGISIEAVIQKEPKGGELSVPLILLTNEIVEQCLLDAIKAIEALDAVKGSVIKLRVENLDG
jgi:homoserine dehydrogenase